MNPEKWSKVKEIFSLAADLLPAERDRFLDSHPADNEVIAEVGLLLAADEKNDFEDALDAVAHLWRDGGPEDFIGRNIGTYEVIREIGRGGMGIVFEAVRKIEDVSQRVALKILQNGMASDALLRRFRHERQILASLEHPNIARLLDAGKDADGAPFLAMEFVDGVPIDDYCSAKSLNVEERLRLFLQTCAAVSFAHSRLVVHRDLKPSNILVTRDGNVKLLDFGISKILSDEETAGNQTVTQLGMMTPEYASPEQIRAEVISTSTDIYSLGLILYELLTGSKAYKFPSRRPDQIARVICEIEPVRPSSAAVNQPPTVADRSAEESASSAVKYQAHLTQDNGQKINSLSKIHNPKSLRGDLDNIILKALRKEPSNRYASIEQFAGDVRRHLEGMPVSARPATFGYRAAKFIGRNQLSVVSGSLASLGVIGGIAGVVWQSIRANRQKQLAERRFEDVRELARNVLFKYHDAIADLPGSTAAREMLIRDASEYLDNLAQETYEDSELEEELAAAYKKIADVQGRVFQANLGDSGTALENYRKSENIYRRLAEKRPRDGEVFKSLCLVSENLALLQIRLARWNEAEVSSQNFFAAARRLIEIEPENLEFQTLYFRSYLARGEAAEFSEGYEGQIKIYRECLQNAGHLFAEYPQHSAIHRLYTTLNQRIGTRLEYWCDDLREQKFPEDEIKLKLNEALRLHFESLKETREMLKTSPNHTVVQRSEAACLNNIGSAYARLGDGVESLKYTSEALERFRRVAGNDAENREAQRDIADGLQYMAMSFEALGATENAIKNYSAALDHLKPLAENDNLNYEFIKQTYDLMNKLGDLQLKNGDFSCAVDYYQHALRLIERHELANTDQLALLKTSSLEKLGDSFVWLIRNLSSKSPDEKKSLGEQAAQLYEQSLIGLNILDKRNRLSRTRGYKIVLLEKKLRNVTSN